jgi:uncharacterized protein YeaO (DUF488 family)
MYAALSEEEAMKQEDLDNWFKYHSPTLDQLSKYNELRNMAKQFAEMFNASVPDCADKTAAIRHLRETVMAMNLAIACNAAKQFAEMFNASVPDCADKTAAIRHLREIVMAMNLAIACNTPGNEEGTQSNLITAKLVSHDAISKEKVLARFPQAYVTSSPKFPAMVSLYTNEGDYYLNATDEQTAWDHMADLIEKANV